MADFETSRRLTNLERLQKKYYQEAAPKKLPVQEVEEQVDRLYSANIKSRNERLVRLEKRYSYHPPGPEVHLSSEQLAENTVRLAKPKNTNFSSHQSYGATHGM
eukprot:NODE_3307_length_789_cov_4.758108_g2764_i0.p1 GENE.NODE_3307_length_789_cov_4.758108_g2764_i0~~NODE_3307_length_789_cov_4.758108_g2764_i0.p1  ORF type:complete len:104 (+),score=25.26 NODE_3307_length_789_cov_4.758108_g2764_i0:262-573(+)